MAYTQNHAGPGDKKERADITNAQVMIQKTDGLFQFFVQGGGYSIPSWACPI